MPGAEQIIPMPVSMTATPAKSQTVGRTPSIVHNQSNVDRDVSSAVYALRGYGLIGTPS